jgi:hypothetical protein
MRIIGEIPHNDCKITLYHWNNRYLIKLEREFLEQTFKIDQFELSSEKDLLTIANQPFIEEAIDRFNNMEHSLLNALQKL